MQNGSTITVVVPVYNGSKYLADALDSLQVQSCQPSEVVIVDDCSSDASLATVATWSARNSPRFPLRVLSTERNSGSPARPLNIGIGAAWEDLIAVLEQDDVFAPSKLLRCSEMFLKHHELNFVTHGACRHQDRRSFGSIAQRNFERDSYWNSRLQQGNESAFFLESSMAVLLAVRHSMFPTGFPGIVFRKSAWEKTGGLPECHKVATDYAFLLELARGGNGCYLPEKLYQRRSHADCLSHNSSLSFLEVLTILKRQIENHPEILVIPGMIDAIIWRTIESAWNIAAFGYRQQASRIIRKATELGGWSITRELQKQATLLMPVYRSIFMPKAVSSEATANAVVDAAEALLLMASTIR
jgi:glycosyltransferase involved in cell wall biosynthesis